MSRNGELYDGDGYPTDAAIAKLESFRGTAEEMAGYIQSLMRNGGAKVEDYLDEWNREHKRLTLVSMGWSGCESVIGALDGTMFHYLFWESSFRGGLHTYTFSLKQWEMESQWGKVTA